MWLTKDQIDKSMSLAKDLIREHGESLTWEQAQQAVLADTIEMAGWSGLKRSGLSPCDALKRLKNLSDGE
jgi:hypothetical protein